MALDDILGKLTVTKDGKRKANGKYDSQVLYGANDGLTQLGKVDLNSREGLEAYKNITGEDPSKYTDRKLDFRKNVRVQAGQEDLGMFIDSHFGNVVDELDEATQTQLAYSFCPTNDIPGDKAKKYNPVRKTVSDAKETIAKIKENPDAYVAEEIRKESPLMAGYIARFKDKFLEIEQMGAQKSAILAIQKYKAANFITDTRKYLSGQATELREKESALNEAIGTKVEMAERNKGRELTVVERTALISDKYAELQKLHEKSADIELGNQLTQETVSYAIGAIREKTEKKD